MRMIIFSMLSVFLTNQAFAERSNGLEDLNLLKNRLIKLYDSSDQSLFQPDYLDVTLKHCEVDIANAPASESQSVFLAIEQSISLYSYAPYRIRFVKLRYDSETDTFLSTNYEPENPKEWTGVCSSSDRSIVDYSEYLDGKCTVALKKDGEIFKGGTPEGGCYSNYGGASYFTSKATIAPNYIKSWDQGFDINGNQVWGAEKGPYIFKLTSADEQSPEIAELASFTVGKLSNTSQHQSNDLFKKTETSICPVKIEGITNAGTKTLFAHQVINDGNTKFSRYRIYEYYKGEGNKIKRDAHKLVDETKFLNFCQTKNPAMLVIPSSEIVFQRNCTMSFEGVDVNSAKAYKGITPEGGCQSTVNGSDYTTIEERIMRGSINILEQWWTNDGQQVGGSNAGPYRYQREGVYWYEM
jgi:CpeT protein